MVSKKVWKYLSEIIVWNNNNNNNNNKDNSAKLLLNMKGGIQFDIWLLAKVTGSGGIS